MDYDDNDFQSQNTHLGGEESTKYPPASQPYALPRFDFDDSLQGHLRFDSLVDSEVFLGFGSNEDNQWIEDFSRGNSAIAFNSTGADTSSVPICKNVWSEATSSESVEMLLKSIGQEEVNLSQRTINDSVSCYELGSVTRQMETSSKIGSGSLSKEVDVTESHGMLTSHEIPDNSLALKKDVSAEDIQGHYTSQTCETSLDGCSSAPKSDVYDKEIGSAVAEVNLPTAEPFTEKDEAKKDTLKDKLVDDYAADLSALDVQVTDGERASVLAEGDLPTAEQFIEKDESKTDTSNDKLVDNLAGDTLKDKLGDNYAADLSASDVQVTDEEKGAVVAVCDLPTGDLLALNVEVTDNERGSAVGVNLTSAEQFTGKDEAKMVTVKDKLVDNYTGDLSASDLQVNNIKCNIELGGQDVSHQSEDKSEKYAEGSEGRCLEGVVQHHGPRDNEFLVDDQNSDGNRVANVTSNLENSCSDSIVEPVSEAKETVMSTFEPSCVTAKDDPSFQIPDECRKLVCETSPCPAKDGDIVDLSVDVRMSAKSDVGMDQVSSAPEALTSPDRRVEEDSNKDASTHASPALTVDAPAQLRCSVKQDCPLNSSTKSNTESSVNEPEKCLMAVAKNLDTIGEVGSTNFQDDGISSLMVVHSSAEPIMEPPADGGVVEDVSGGCSEIKEPTTILSEFKQKCDEDTHNRQVDNVECGNNRPMIVEEGSELSADPNKNDSRNSGTEGNVDEEKLELKSQHNEPVQITHMGKVVTSAQVPLIVNLASPTVPSAVVCEPESTFSQMVDSSRYGGEGPREIDNQPLLAVDTESKKLHQDVRATKSNQGSNQKMGVSTAMSDPEVKEGNMMEESTSLGRLEDAIGQVNSEKVSRVAELEGSPGPAALSELNAELKSSDNESSHAESNKAACDSPTVFKSVVLPHSVDKTEEFKVDGDYGAEFAKENDKDSSKALSSPRVLSGNDASKDGEDFTFELSSIADVAGTEAGKPIQAASTISSSMTPQLVGETTSSPSLGLTEIKTSHDSPVGEVVRAGPKVSSERKSRRTPGKALSKDNAKKGKTLKEATARQTDKGKKSLNTSFGPPGICSPLQSPGLHLFGNVECSSGKKIGILATPTPSVPDLNTTAPSSSLYHQPFTDLQQVQLRAQIFVYGALIQGMVPDEPYMTSAFGGSDGGRNSWEGAWRISMERLQSQNLSTLNPETPSQSCSGSGVTDQPNNPSVYRNKVSSTSVSQAGSRGAPPSSISPMIPLSSPLWAYPTPSSDGLQPSGLPRGPVFDYKQTMSPLHSYQTPPLRNVVGKNTSLMPQASFRGPWVASPQTSGSDSGTHFPLYPTEVVQLTPVRESPVSQSSGAKNASAAPWIQSGSPGNMLTSTFPTVNINKMVASTVEKPGSKSRKRRKSSIPENPNQTSGQPQSNSEMISIPTGSSHPSVSLGTVTPPGLSFKGSTENVMMHMSPVEQMRNLLDNEEQMANLSEETLCKIKEARVHAENAASTAATATNHCQELWSGLAKHLTLGLVPEIEDRLSSAAAAIAAAACVAKAAASAANVASNAALQAKLMAEEALVSNSYIKVHSDDVNNANATASSTLKGGNGAPTSNSLIVVAKEAARRRVEAATAASRQAENMDAIVKAAELAAEAVSHAGKIVAIGNPLALSELVKSGPEGYWKTELACSSGEGRKEHLGISNDGEAPGTSKKHYKRGTSANIDAQGSTRLKSSGSRERAGHGNDDGMSGSAAARKIDGGLEGGKVSDMARTIGVVPESETASKTSITVHSDHDLGVQTLTQSSIAVGCLVEVYRDADGSAAWYEANVLDLKDKGAFVCYTELKSDEGPGNLKEWVSLDGDSEAPRIRIARPMGATQFEGKRKRRRAAIRDYNWSVGDRVDAWVQDRWCEGIVTERNKKDSTSFTVQFPERTSDVKAWHLRPSFIWRDGNWVELCQSRGKHSHESDSPLGKRQKMGTTSMEKGKDKIPKNGDSVESGKPEDVSLLDLAANEKTFNMGKSNRDEKKQETLRSLQTNLQKGGSRVIFGVPKPGKKRKFMEVSKHYVLDQGGKNSEANKSTKIAKYLMPQCSGSRGSKGTAKGGLKEKGPVTKPKIPKSGKSHGSSTRNIIHKDKDVDSSVSAAGEEAVAERNDNMKESTSHVHSTSGKQRLERSSVFRPDGSAVSGSFVFSSVAASSDIPSRRTSSSDKTGRANKGKLAPASSGVAKFEEKVSNKYEANSSSEVMEPRRSNRRIQPTSRLLEGLQSSFISRIPSVPYDRSHKSQNRSASRGSSRH